MLLDKVSFVELGKSVFHEINVYFDIDSMF